MEEKLAAHSAELRSQVDQLQTEVRSAIAKVEAAEKRVTELETVMGDHSDAITVLENDITAIKRELTESLLKERSEDLEARS